MVTALYRRYRPESFGELIGQSQVTDPLRTALRADRVNHAYLFSGPRGCGKTTSARILARCLNCAQGPTDTPCGVCDSCVELGRGGGGSLDVVEIDAASHNGVDDAREIRERAVFAPARDRYKIFILDEAHMVTPQGFNALLKIVEEPPEHVKFIFATTEPDKVIGTIRSRTHHYPFRLVPPAQMLEYLGQLCATEGVSVAPGVLPLVVRAGGGSVRDTLSLLDQLMAGSENDSVDYERAVSLLGYTHGALLDDVVVALGQHDAGGAFAAVDRVIQTGQDPRRFVEDLLERLRDLIVVGATGDSAGTVLRGVPDEQIEAYRTQAQHFGTAELSRVADVVNTALTDMTGATSPRLHLELMIARALVPTGDASGALARVERLERRVGVDGGNGGASGGESVRPAVSFEPSQRASESRQQSAPAPRPVDEAAAPRPTPTPIPEPQAAPAEAPAPAASTRPAPATAAPGESRAAGQQSPAPSRPAPVSEPGWEVRIPGQGLAGSTTPSPASAPAATPAPRTAPSGAASVARSAPSAPGDGWSTDDLPPVPDDSEAPPADDEPTPPRDTAPRRHSAPSPATPEPRATVPAPTRAPVAGPLELAQVRDSWPEILEAVRKTSVGAWTIVYTAQPLILNGDVLTLGFVSENDVQSFRQQQAEGKGISEMLRQAILEVLGTRVKFLVRVDAPAEPAPAPHVVDPSRADESRRYGESVVREILGANFIEERQLPPRGQE